MLVQAAIAEQALQAMAHCSSSSSQLDAETAQAAQHLWRFCNLYVGDRSRAYLNDSVLDTLVLDMIVLSVTSAVSLKAQCKAKPIRLTI